MPRTKQKPKAAANHAKCLWDDSPVLSRGLCSACYRNAARKADGDPKKWQQLEDAGLCLPAQTAGRCGILVKLANVKFN